MDFVDWNRNLLLGALLIVIAGMSLVSGRTVRDRILAAGILSQGILMTFVAGSAYFPRAELEIAATTIFVVFCSWCVWFTRDQRDQSHSSDPPVVISTAFGLKIDSAGGVAEQATATPDSAKGAT